MAMICKGSMLALALCASALSVQAASKAPEEGSEYKLMLDPMQFTGDEETTKAKVTEYWNELKARIQDASPSRQVSGELTFNKQRTVMFYDVPGTCELRKAGYILRERVDADGDRELTLKYRSPDRKVSASRKVAGKDPEAETKFEDDITASSKPVFSHSSTQPIQACEKINRVKDIVSSYPGFSQEGLSNKLPLARVGNLTVHETTYKNAAVDLDGLPAKFSLTLWYAKSDSTEPALAEMSFSYEKKKKKYTTSVADNAMRLLSTMHDMSPWTLRTAVSDDGISGNGQGNAGSPPGNLTKTAWIYSRSSFCEK